LRINITDTWILGEPNTSEPWSPRREEFHVTVEGSPVEWYFMCKSEGVKPLWIELNTGELQLMCAARSRIVDFGPDFRIIRVKREVSETYPGEHPTYYECHVKLDGPFQRNFPMSSRDLYRAERWYATKRSPRPFNPTTFVEAVRELAPNSRVRGYEYEIAIEDTNRLLDDKWIRET
jgi:hypothetical protein